MTLNSSGPISLGGSTTGESINTEIGFTSTTTTSLNNNNVRTIANTYVTPPQTVIQMPTDFYNKSNTAYLNLIIGTNPAFLGDITTPVFNAVDDQGNLILIPSFGNAASQTFQGNFAGSYKYWSRLSNVGHIVKATVKDDDGNIYLFVTPQSYSNIIYIFKFSPTYEYISTWSLAVDPGEAFVTAKYDNVLLNGGTLYLYATKYIQADNIYYLVITRVDISVNSLDVNFNTPIIVLSDDYLGSIQTLNLTGRIGAYAFNTNKYSNHVFVGAYQADATSPTNIIVWQMPVPTGLPPTTTPNWKTTINGSALGLLVNSGFDTEYMATTADSSGNIYIAYCQSNSGQNLPYVVAFIKLNSSGVLQWAKNFSGTSPPNSSDTYRVQIAVDGNGDVYLALSKKYIELGSNNVTYFILGKFNSSGTQIGGVTIYPDGNPPTYAQGEYLDLYITQPFLFSQNENALYFGGQLQQLGATSTGTYGVGLKIPQSYLTSGTSQHFTVSNSGLGFTMDKNQTTSFNFTSVSPTVTYTTGYISGYPYSTVYRSTLYYEQYNLGNYYAWVQQI